MSNSPEYQREWRRKNRERTRAYQREYQKVWRKKRYENDPKFREEIKRRTREWRKAHPEHKLDTYLRREYGIALAEYNYLLEKQGGVCAICKREEARGNGRVKKVRLPVDHDHKTNAVRGLLCSDCNRALGLFQDSIETLQRAIDYLNDRRNRISDSRTNVS